MTATVAPDFTERINLRTNPMGMFPVDPPFRWVAGSGAMRSPTWPRSTGYRETGFIDLSEIEGGA